jgi:hypothetical protein
MGNQLVEFFRNRKQHGESENINWNAKKGDWIRSVEGLYDVVEGMLGESIASNDVAVRRVATQVTEELVGTYSIPVLELTIGNERVEFQPKGLTVIGASGRVDLLGGRDRITLVLDRQAMQDSWHIVLQRVPKLKTAPLDQDSLQHALEKVMLPLS